MNETPRRADLDEPSMPTRPHRESTPSDADDRPTAAGAAAGFPLWLIVAGVVVFALVMFYIATVVFPGSATDL